VATRSPAWDPGGFGHGCGDGACARAAIDAAVARGARAVKVVVGADGLSTEVLAAAVAHAHDRGLPVVAHALTDAEAAAAAAAGCDALAHTPVEPLTEATVAAWRGRAVISTLAAFGGGAAAIDNLRRLRAAGAVVLYGTDLGNRRVAGIDPVELDLLAAAGLDGAAVVEAMTTARRGSGGSRRSWPRRPSRWRRRRPTTRGSTSDRSRSSGAKATVATAATARAAAAAWPAGGRRRARRSGRRRS
jgi:hypothetical protein